MKQKSIVFVVIFLAMISCIIGCSGTKVEGPGIVFENETFKFGRVDEGKTVAHTFVFTNNGTQPVIISEVRPTCGCTVAGDHDREVPPGKKGKIPLEFRSTGFEGNVTKTIRVVTNVPGKEEISLVLEGEVKPTITLSPRSIFLGSLTREQNDPLKGSVTISNKLSGPVKITGITVPRDQIITELVTVKEGYEFTLNVTVSPPFKDGQTMESILMKTDSSVKPELNLSVSYYREPLVKVYPNPLFVSMEMIANGDQKEITIEGHPTVNMKIADLSVKNDKITLSLKQVEKGKKFSIMVRFPKDFTFENTENITVNFKVKNIPEELDFSVPIYRM